MTHDGILDALDYAIDSAMNEEQRQRSIEAARYQGDHEVIDRAKVVKAEFDAFEAWCRENRQKPFLGRTVLMYGKVNSIIKHNH
jgi:hypothetical protein